MEVESDKGRLAHMGGRTLVVLESDTGRPTHMGGQLRRSSLIKAD